MSLPLYLSYTLNFVQEDPPQVCHNPRCSSFKVLFCCQYFVAQLAKRQPVPNTVKIQMKHKLLLSSMFYNFAFCEIELKKNQYRVSKIKIWQVNGLDNVPVTHLNYSYSDFRNDSTSKVLQEIHHFPEDFSIMLHFQISNKQYIIQFQLQMK